MAPGTLVSVHWQLTIAPAAHPLHTHPLLHRYPGVIFAFGACQVAVGVW
jgi:hypothetical protein